jgi:hypothetical protein
MKVLVVDNLLSEVVGGEVIGQAKSLSGKEACGIN